MLIYKINYRSWKLWSRYPLAIQCLVCMCTDFLTKCYFPYIGCIVREASTKFMEIVNKKKWWSSIEVMEGKSPSSRCVRDVFAQVTSECEQQMRLTGHCPALFCSTCVSHWILSSGHQEMRSEMCEFIQNTKLDERETDSLPGTTSQLEKMTAFLRGHRSVLLNISYRGINYQGIPVSTISIWKIQKHI